MSDLLNLNVSLQEAAIPQAWNTEFRWLILLHNVSAFQGLCQVHELVCITPSPYRAIYTLGPLGSLSPASPDRHPFTSGSDWIGS